MKGFAFLIIALFIDALQLMLSFTIASIGAVLPFVSWVSLPASFVVAYVINVTISLTIGSALVMGLAMSGMFAPVRTLMTYFSELLPGANNAPVWTILVIMSILRTRAQKGGLLGVAASVVSMAVPGGKLKGATPTTRRVASARSLLGAAHPQTPLKQTSSRIALHDIRPSRPANDNVPNQPYGIAA
jgi:hypothetical protein